MGGDIVINLVTAMFTETGFFAHMVCNIRMKKRIRYYIISSDIESVHIRWKPNYSVNNHIWYRNISEEKNSTIFS